MGKKCLLAILIINVCTSAFCQTTFRETYEQFRKQAQSDYENFRDSANRQYAEFMRQAWEQHQIMPALPKPKEEEKPPVVMPKEDEQKPVEDNPVVVDDDIILPPEPEPQPTPVAPIREEPVVEESYLGFTFYGVELRVRIGNDKISLPDCSEETLSDAWVQLSGKEYNNTVRDCLEHRIRLQLSDWGYLQMLREMSHACLGKTNEANLLMAFVFCQSGYKMRLGIANEKLYMLFASKHVIFDLGRFELDGEYYYPFQCDEKEIQICSVGFPKETPLSLLIPQEQLLGYKKSKGRTLTSERYPEMSFSVGANKNLIAFYNDYPTSMLDRNFMTRWAMYANTPMEKTVKSELYPALREKLKNLSQKEAMERLLNWVQTAFVYEYDNKVWGGDRAFFAEESLYYPYCDCEDRSILLSRLVRDLLGLKAILIYYPGHLAMAVRFTEDVKGDYILLDGNKFVVCDPTYIGAPVGMTMPDMDNHAAKVILLE